MRNSRFNWSRAALWLLVFASPVVSIASLVAARTASLVELQAPITHRNIDGYAPNTHVDFEFEIGNPTLYEIVISQVETSCTCTDFAVSPKYLGPGAKAVLSGQISTGVYSQVSSHLVVYYRSTKDAQMRSLRFLIEGEPREKDVAGIGDDTRS